MQNSIMRIWNVLLEPTTGCEDILGKTIMQQILEGIF